MDFMKVLFFLFLLLIILLSSISEYKGKPECLLSRDPIICEALTK